MIVSEFILCLTLTIKSLTACASAKQVRYDAALATNVPKKVPSMMIDSYTSYLR